MSQARIDAIVIAGGILLWIGIFVASWQGRLHVSGLVSDAMLAIVAGLVAYRIWRMVRRRSPKGG